MLSITIAALGDSLTDEYRFYAPYRTSAENWPEIISTLRQSQVNFGPLTTRGRRGTRNQGYAEDWARSGATAEGVDLEGAGTTFVEQYEGDAKRRLPGLLTQPGGIAHIDVVNILIGSNDYIRALADSQTNPIKFFTNLATANTDILKALKKLVPLIHAANPNTHVIIDNIPPVTDFPLLERALTLLPAQTATLATTAINSDVSQINSEIAQYAQNHGAGVVDVNGLIRNFVNHSYIDGVYINPKGVGPIDTDFFLGDGIHPGTVAQGLLTNAIIAQIDSYYPGAITPLSSAEIVHLAASAQPKTLSLLTATSAKLAPGGTVVIADRLFRFPPVHETSADPPAPRNLESYPVPTGTVKFIDASHGDEVLATVRLNSAGVASFRTSSLKTGLNQITAIYSGDRVYPPSTSEGLSIAVEARAQTTQG
jgi:lysophospholipase L1-like esterase